MAIVLPLSNDSKRNKLKIADSPAVGQSEEKDKQIKVASMPSSRMILKRGVDRQHPVVVGIFVHHY